MEHRGADDCIALADSGKLERGRIIIMFRSKMHVLLENAGDAKTAVVKGLSQAGAVAKVVDKKGKKDLEDYGFDDRYYSTCILTLF